MGLSRIVSKISGDISWKSEFSQPLYFAPRWRVPLGIGHQRSISRKLEWWCYPAEKEVWRYLQPSGYNTRTWQTDVQTYTGWQQRPRLRIESRGKKLQRRTNFDDFGKQCQHTFKNDVAIQLSLSLQLYLGLLYLFFNSSDGKFAMLTSLVRQSVSSNRKHRILSLQICGRLYSPDPVYYWIWGLMMWCDDPILTCAPKPADKPAY